MSLGHSQYSPLSSTVHQINFYLPTGDLDLQSKPPLSLSFVDGVGGRLFNVNPFQVAKWSITIIVIALYATGCGRYEQCDRWDYGHSFWQIITKEEWWRDEKEKRIIPWSIKNPIKSPSFRNRHTCVTGMWNNLLIGQTALQILVVVVSTALR